MDIVFHTLNREQLRGILDIELDTVQKRVSATEPERIFDFRCTPTDFLSLPLGS